MKTKAWTSSFFGLTFLFFNLLFLPFILRSQSTLDSLSAQHKSEVINSLREHIAEHYVIENKAKQLDLLLKKQLEEQGYAKIKSPEAFAEQLTSDLKQWSGDLHFFVFFLRPLKPGTLPPPGFSREDPFGEIKMLEGDIAYIQDIKKISNTKDRISEAMKKVADAKALILDFRTCTGGSRNTTRFLISYFFDQATHFSTEYERGEKPRKIKTLKKVPGKRLSNLPIYILTSPTTASGCEAVAFFLKNHKKATILGETTMGAAHAVKSFDLANNFKVFIPRIKTLDAIKETDWEGKGVVPDIQMPPQEAFEKAYQLATKKN